MAMPIGGAGGSEVMMAGGGGGGQGGGLFKSLFDEGMKKTKKSMDRFTGAQFLSDLDSIATGNNMAQISAGQAAAAGAGINVPGASDVGPMLTPQDAGASHSERDALAEFKARRDAKEQRDQDNFDKYLAAFGKGGSR